MYTAKAIVQIPIIVLPSSGYSLDLRRWVSYSHTYVDSLAVP
jgi:hypothetical protein